jgi:glycosyltransferase involved in cell wall biosynthesis
MSDRKRMSNAALPALTPPWYYGVAMRVASVDQARPVSTTWHLFQGAERRDLRLLGEALGNDYFFLTDLLPLPTIPSGFNHRYASIIRRLCDLGSTTLHVALRRGNIALRSPPEEISLAVSTAFPGLTHLVLTVHDPVRVPHRRVRGVVNVVLRRLSTSLPDVPKSYCIESRLVVAQAGLAHLGLDRSASGALYLLEEGFERRSKELGHPIKARLKYPIKTLGLRRLYTRISTTGAPVVVLTENERRHFSRWIKRENIHVVPLSIDLGAYEGTEAREGGRSEPFTIGVFGRLGDPRYREPLRELLGAAEDSRASWRFLLVGWGSEQYSSLRDEAEHIVVDITGFVDQIVPYYRQLDCVVVPETVVTGFKTSVLQAWAAGVPCVVSQATGRSCAVRDEEDGLVYADVHEALVALERLRHDVALAARLTQNGRKRLKDHDGARSAMHVTDLLLGG